MNNVLDYRGYRFFQSSYDQDEGGTILSVNHDMLGTVVSYIGYFLLALGMIMVFFTSKTRFAFLNKQLNKVKGKVALFLLGVLFSVNLNADTNIDSLLISNTINSDHIKNFEKLLVQDNGGRIKPVNTVCSEFLRKVSRKDNIIDQNATQVVVGMMKNPKLWSNVSMIKISHDKLKLLLQTEENRVSFRTFFTEDGDYILKDEVDRVNSKAPINRDKYDKDVLTVDERVNICFTIYNGDIFRFFPLANDSNNTWFTARENSFFSGKDSLFVTNIMYMYMNALDRAFVDGNWVTCDSVVFLDFKTYMENKLCPKIIKLN